MKSSKKNKRDTSTAWRALEKVMKVMELGGVTRSENQLVEDLKKSHIVADSMSAANGIFDPMTSDK